MSTQSVPTTGVAAGVPFLAMPPTTASGADAPLVVAWHLMDPPRTESAFAAALPMAGLDAWRVYLGLPLSGSRLPAGGYEELQRLGYDDAVRNLQGPVTFRGAEEFPSALAELRDRFGLSGGPLALVGGSAGSAVAQLVMAAVLISPISELRAAVDALANSYGIVYHWSDASLRIAARLDFVAHADQTAAAGEPAIRLIVGAADDRAGFIEPAGRLRAALSERYHDRSLVDLITVADMGHALANEPGTEPAPQTAAAAIVDGHTVEWLQRHLIDRRGRNESSP